MCTLMTITRGFFRQHRKSVIDQIVDDQYGNPHGYALELIGKSPLFLQGFDIDRVIDMLDTDFDRFVLHQRFATSRNVSLCDCHGYVAENGYRWYHNGIIENFLQLRVDSINLTQCIDMKDALSFFMGSYANIMCTRPDGSLQVGRASKSGCLFKDAKGLNFSTNPVGSIVISVDCGEVYDIKPKVKKAKALNYGFGEYLNEDRELLIDYEFNHPKSKWFKG